MPDLTPIQIIGGLATSAVSGGGASSFFTWLTTRKKSTAEGKAYTMGAVDHAVQTAMSSVTSQLERTEERLEKVEGEHEECRANLLEVKEDLASARQEINRLMNGRPLPAYHLNADRSDANKGAGK
jgi:exonuclease VII small subunit